MHIKSLLNHVHHFKYWVDICLIIPRRYRIYHVTISSTFLFSKSTVCSAGFRTNEALCQLSYEAPYLGPEGGIPGRPTLAVRHTCSGNLGIVKILRYISSDMYTASATNSKLLYITQSPNSPNTLLHRSHDEIVKLDKKRTDRAVNYSQCHVIKSKHHLTQWFSTFVFPMNHFYS